MPSLYPLQRTAQRFMQSKARGRVQRPVLHQTSIERIGDYAERFKLAPKAAPAGGHTTFLINEASSLGSSTDGARKCAQEYKESKH